MSDFKNYNLIQQEAMRHIQKAYEDMNRKMVDQLVMMGGPIKIPVKLDIEARKEEEEIVAKLIISEELEAMPLLLDRPCKNCKVKEALPKRNFCSEDCWKFHAGLAYSDARRLSNELLSDGIVQVVKAFHPQDLIRVYAARGDFPSDGEGGW